MLCKEVKHIIDQVMNREIPSEALDDMSEHIDGCEECREYLKESQNLRALISECGSVEPNHEFFATIEDNLEEKESRKSVWEIMFANYSIRSMGLVTAVLAIAIISAFTIFSYSMDSSKSFSDRKMEATMKKMPEGAVLMRTPDGEEVIFLDPALDSNRNGDDIVRELDQVLQDEQKQNLDDFSFASSD